MVNWIATIWIEEKGMIEGSEEYIPPLSQTEMNDLIKKAIQVINKGYEDVKVMDFEAYIDKEDELNKRGGL